MSRDTGPVGTPRQAGWGNAGNGGNGDHAGNAGNSARQPLAILFVDPDLERITRLAQELPRPIDYRIVPSAQVALNAVHTRMPDLIVTELNLPDANGVNLIEHLHFAPNTRNILFLVFTVRTSVRDKIAAFQAGADDYLVKPSNAQELAVHIHLLSRFQRVIGRN
jgi:DNA-binding response OmpR family regulator